MSDSSESQVVQLPNLLRAKVGTKTGPSLDQIVAEAEAALAHMLHAFIDRNRQAAVRNLDLIAGHIDFMNLIIKSDINDQGGLTEHELLAALESATKKVLEARPGL